jgi:hypothetical protein
LEADDFRELADGLEQRAAAGAQIADVIGRTCRPGEAGPAGYALEVGHRVAFSLGVMKGLYMKTESRFSRLVFMLGERTPSWSFLTNHAQVLLCIAQDPGIRLREIGEAVGITERAVHRIVVELATAGYISRERNGRRNQYRIQSHLPVPEPLAREKRIGDLLAILAEQDSTGT